MKDTRRGIITPIVLLLLSVVGLGVSLYLLDVYLEVKSGAATGDRVCTLSESVNCEAVAASDYSIFLGLPLAVWGILFYSFMIFATTAQAATRDRGRFSWDAAIFWPTLIVFIDDLYLGYLQFSCIHSICIFCFITYGINLAMLLLLGASRGFRVDALFGEALSDVRWFFESSKRAVPSVIVAAAALGVVGWFWAHPVGGVELTAPSHHAHVSSSEPVMGPKDAPIQVLGITDFQCPYCAKAAEVASLVMKKYADRLRFEHVDYPLDQACNVHIPKPFHRQACQASFASRCAGRQDQYWPYHHLLFGNQRRLSDEVFRELAEELKLDLAAFDACMKDADGSLDKAIKADIERARGFKIRGTPTFIVNGRMMAGFIPMEKWDAVIAEELTKAGASK